jgi:hypothetical protein
MRLLDDGTRVARDARHYADLHALGSRPEVLAMLRSPEYEEIRNDYDRLSSKWFPRSHRPPPRLSFGESPALFPTADLRVALAADYTAQCALLFPGDFPSFADVLGSFELLREWL